MKNEAVKILTASFSIFQRGLEIIQKLAFI